LQAAEHESVALVAAIDEAVDELGGLQKDLGGRHLHKKLFIAEAAQFPALVHVHEDSIVKLGGSSAASPYGTIDSRKVDSETVEQDKVTINVTVYLGLEGNGSCNKVTIKAQ
jgi:hypothetical protein